MGETRARNRDWHDLVAVALLTGRPGGWRPVERMDSEYQADRAAGNLNYAVHRRGHTDAPPLLNLPPGDYLFEARGAEVWGRSL